MKKKIYSIIIQTLIILSFTKEIHAQGWEWQNPLPQGNRLGEVQFVDMNYGWIRAGSNILRTTNSGLQWEVEYVGHSFGPNSIYFVDDLNGWGVGSGIPPFIVKTIDGGITWEDLPIPEERGNGNYYNFWDVFFVDTLTGYFCDDIGAIFKTSDGGQTWIGVFQFIPPFRDIKSILFLDTLRGWAIGDTPLMKTTDGGNIWERDSTIFWELESREKQIVFVDSLHGWIMTQQFIYRTINNGEQWEKYFIDSVVFNPGIDDPLVNQLTFLDQKYGWLATSKGLYFSSDSGKVWDNRNLEYNFKGVHFLDLFNGLATGNEPMKIENKYYKTTDGGFTWQDQSFSITNRSLTGVSFINDVKGWAVGLDGLIIQTTNGGVNWQLQESGVNDRLTDVKFWNENFGMIAAENGKILNTTNGGQTWTSSIVREGFRFEEISFVSPTNIWIAGWNWDYEGIVIHTTNGGISWEDQTPENANRLFSVSFIDSLNGWITSGGGTIYDIGRAWNTNDGGNSWSLVIDGPYWAFEKVRFVDTLTGWIASANDLLRTTDGGTHWELIEDITSFYISDFTLIDKNKCWVTSQFGQIVYSDNGGKNWKNQESKVSSHSLRKIEFIDENIGWAVGDFGSILHTETGGITAVNGQNSSINPPLSFQLYQNYPNPFNPSTTIRFSLTNPAKLQLRVFNALGGLVKVLVDNRLGTGQHEVVFDASKLSSGVYYYQLISGEFSVSKGMVLLK